MVYISEFLNILNAMSPYLLLGFFISGLLYVYVPTKIYKKYLSKRGVKSVILSALMGVPLPLCSCGVIPAAMSIKKEGASDGASVSFLIATPQTGVDSILATYSLMGLPFAIIRPIVAFIVAIFGGVSVNKFGKEKIVEQKATSCCCHSQKTETSKSCCSDLISKKRHSFVEALHYGFIKMIGEFGKLIIIGLIIATLITVLIPNSFFELFSEYYILNILAILLLSIPMYICATGSIPIALSLMLKGISPGAAFVFLMAGPATNVATLTVLRKSLGLRTTLIYLSSIIIGSIGFAFIIDFMLPSEWFIITMNNQVETHDHSNEWLNIGSSAIFCLLLIYSFIKRIKKQQ